MGETPVDIAKERADETRVAQAIGGGSGDDDDLQARLDSLRR
jgi:charged multivesicular body protein 2A